MPDPPIGQAIFGRNPWSITGHAIAASFKNDTRKRENFQATGFVGLDFDGGVSITEVMQDPFILDYAFLLYTTASHLGDGITERFRVLWALPEDLTDRSEVEAVLKGLLKKYPNADKACKDASRMFYGNTQAQFRLVQDVTLPALIVDELKNTDIEPIKQPIDQSSRRQTSYKSAESSPAIHHDIEEVKRALSYIPPRKPGSGNYQTCLTVLMALNSGLGADKAIELAEEWSPSQTGWDIQQKINGFTSTEVTLGSLFWIASQHGFIPRPSSHAKTTVEAIVPTREINAQYLPADVIPWDKKLVVIKSYQGTGKTQAITKQVNVFKADGKVIVIAHRRTLLRQISHAFGIANYEDVIKEHGTLKNHAESIAITFDSLYKLTPGDFKGALVVLDEFTQGLRHLVGDTCKGNRVQILQSLDFLLKNAKQIISSDADAGDLEINYLQKRSGNPDVYYVVNKWTPKDKQIVIYAAKATLQAEVFASVESDKPIVVACDSKALSDEFNLALTRDFPTRRIVTINSGNSSSDEIQKFIGDINNASQDVDVLIYSPSLFTGVDINTSRFQRVF